jgi:sterol desaturase/sphingolipid hydroxylase (fatty acid hydroxylase superfamily)
MRLSKFSYYSDFAIYPVVCAGLAAASVRGAGWVSGGKWFGALAAGLMLWTFLEYVLHRIAFHSVRWFVPMHGAHHRAPLAFIGTPTWLSVSVLGSAIGIPTWLYFGFGIAGGLTVGVMAGYWWYGIVHHVIHHHAHKRSNAYFSELRAWHMRHHYSPRSGNFGVTTGLWDHVFGTVIGARCDFHLRGDFL